MARISLLPSFAFALVIVGAGLLLMQCNLSRKTALADYGVLPVLLRTVPTTDGEMTLQPLRMHIVGDSLFVAYKDREDLDVYTLDLQKVGRILLDGPEPMTPSAFTITDSNIISCSQVSGVIALYDRRGKYLDSYGTLPDKTTRLSPMDVIYYGGVLYIADTAVGRVLAVSMVDAPGLTERGELILTIPTQSEQRIGFPSAVHVTPDGRLLVGDASDGLIRVFTCDGRPVYTFQSIPGAGALAPQGIDMDDVIDPTLQDSASFDPSGLRRLGRIHVVDAHSGQVHMYNPLGRYVASYPETGRLSRPTDIAIDRKGKRIFIADPGSEQIQVFSYAE